MQTLWKNEKKTFSIERLGHESKGGMPFGLLAVLLTNKGMSLELSLAKGNGQSQLTHKVKVVKEVGCFMGLVEWRVDEARS